MQDEAPKRSFKVVDRRRFTDDGELRPGVAAAETAPSAPEPVSPAPASPAAASEARAPASPASAPDAAAPAQPSPTPAANAADAAPSEPTPQESKQPPQGHPLFAGFIQSLGHQAISGLGMAPWPDSGLVQPDLRVARESIELLAMLAEKTHGNLTRDEAELLLGLLNDLRMAYVQVAQAASAAGPAGPGAPGGPGMPPQA